MNKKQLLLAVLSIGLFTNVAALAEDPAAPKVVEAAKTTKSGIKAIPGKAVAFVGFPAAWLVSKVVSDDTLNKVVFGSVTRKNIVQFLGAAAVVYAGYKIANKMFKDTENFEEEELNERD